VVILIILECCIYSLPFLAAPNRAYWTYSEKSGYNHLFEIALFLVPITKVENALSKEAVLEIFD
jgi:hypothetical protein